MQTSHNHVKLQNAYVTEANAVGGYTIIGYEIPGSSTFDYTASTDIGAGATIEVISLTAAKMVGRQRTRLP